jgi:hypothetical protein
MNCERRPAIAAGRWHVGAAVLLLLSVWLVRPALSVGVAPLAAPSQETGGRAGISDVANLVAAFDETAWFDTIQTLAENHGKRSRAALRVRQVTWFRDSDPVDDACDLAADWIAGRLRALGYIVEEDDFPHTIYSSLSEKVAEFRLRNVIASKPGRGTNRSRILLLAAHYDSKASSSEGWEAGWRTMPAPGANDNATGVAVLLEIARLLADADTDYTVRFAFFSAEELGLFGSRHYAKKAAQEGADIVGVLNVDMLGHDADGLFDVHVVGNARSQWLLGLVGVVGARFVPAVHIVPHRDPDWVFSDHAPFWWEGYSAVTFADELDFDASEFYPVYHTSEDTPDRVHRMYGASAARLVVAVAAALAGVREKGAPVTPDLEGAPPIVAASVYPNPYVVAGGKPLAIQYQLSRDAAVDVAIYDAAGKRLFGVSHPAGSAFGRYGLNAPVLWDGRNERGEPLPVGSYFVRVRSPGDGRRPDVRTVRLMLAPNDSVFRRYDRRLTPNP